MRVTVLDGLHGYAGDRAGQLQPNVDALLGAHSSEPVIPARGRCPVLNISRGRFQPFADEKVRS